MADRILPDVIAAARQYGTDLAKQAADVLEKWDRQANADSLAQCFSSTGRRVSWAALPWVPRQALPCHTI